MPFVTSPDMYPKYFHIPKYYKGIKDVGLLSDNNIGNHLKKYKNKLNKRQKEYINKFLETI